MSLLELINTPCDDKLGSPMQRLMGHRAKALVPITNNLLKPNLGPDKTEKVASKQHKYRHTQKFYYDRNTTAKDQLKLGDPIRMHSPEGWKLAEFISDTEYLRLHIVQAGDSGHEYC